MSLYIPELTPGTTVLEAAWQYAAAGWYVGPASVQTKHPGSLLGKGWPEASSRDPELIRTWFTRWPEAGLFLHLGKSGATGIDVDHPEKLGQMHPDFARAVYNYIGPVQTTREGLRPVADHSLGTGGSAQRSHLLFLTPPGRRISNSNGDTGKGWGEVRGENGVFIVQPSMHTKVNGRYLWERTGWVHPMPAPLAVLLKDASAKVDAASHAQLLQVRSTATGSADAGLFARGPLAHYNSLIERGAHRHETLVEVLPWVMREALAGLYPLAWAEDQIRALHLAACADPGLGSGAVRLEDEAGAEFDDVAAWALGHARRADPAAVNGAVMDRVRPNLAVPTAWVSQLPVSAQQNQNVAQPPYPFGDPGGGRASAPVSALAPLTPGLRLTWATSLTQRASRWLWEEDRFQWIPLGGLVLLGGREGVGKSTLAFRLAAGITLGKLPGDCFGAPRNVIIAATEDAWEQTIQPRLIAAGADLARIARVDITSADGTLRGLSLVTDTAALRAACEEHQVALILLDPLLSTVGGTLDTHKDSDVRKALEPLSRMAAELQLTVIGLIHQNKSTGADILTRLMGSRAFSAVARAVLLCARKQEDEPDPDDEFASVIDPQGETFVFGQLKSNLGPPVLATIEYRIEGVVTGHDYELDKPIRTSRLVIGETVPVKVTEMVLDDSVKRKAPVAGQAGEVMNWLLEYLRTAGAAVPSSVVRQAAADAGYAVATLYRARKSGGVQSVDVEGVQCWQAPPAYVAGMK